MKNNNEGALHDSTHWLKCRHNYTGRYYMACDVLRKTKSGKLKVRVYGRLYWGGDKESIRYVEPFRVLKREPEDK